MLKLYFDWIDSGNVISDRYQPELHKISNQFSIWKNLSSIQIGNSTPLALFSAQFSNDDNFPTNALQYRFAKRPHT